MRSSLKALGLVVSLCVACNPDPISGGGGQGGTGGDAIGGAGGEQSGGANSAGGDQGGGVSAQCGNGVREAGEICFGAPTVVAAEAGNRNVLAGDVDGDGDLDLVTGSNLLTNDGAGHFTVSDPFMTSPYASNIALADVDGDTDLDVVAPRDTSIEVRRNLGTGSFQASEVIPMISQYGYDAAVTDFDGDGTPDVVVGTLDGTIELWNQIDVGWAGDIEAQSATSWVRDVLALDLNGDGEDELIATAEASVLRVKKGGVWTEYPTFTQYVKLAHGDFNHDGKVDVAGGLWAPAGHGVQILFGDGNGGFSGDALVETSFFTRALAAGDIDGDGLDDLVAASIDEVPPKLAVALSTAQGLGAAQEQGAPCGAHHLELADLDGDGAPDLAMLCFDPASGPVEVMLSAP